MVSNFSIEHSPFNVTQYSIGLFFSISLSHIAQKCQDVFNWLQILSKCHDIRDLDQMAAELRSPASQREPESCVALKAMLCACKCSAETDLVGGFSYLTPQRWSSHATWAEKTHACHEIRCRIIETIGDSGERETGTANEIAKKFLFWMQCIFWRCCEWSLSVCSLVDASLKSVKLKNSSVEIVIVAVEYDDACCPWWAPCWLNFVD